MSFRRLPARLAAAVLCAAATAGMVGCRPTTTVRTEGAEPVLHEIDAKAVAQQTQGRPRVLFIRGANGTAGAGPDGPDDGELADITNITQASNSHGYGNFAKALADAGYDVAQLHETGGLDAKQKVDLKKANLGQYKVVIFGSNNAVYNTADAATVKDYVEKGGGVLFMSDLNFGTKSGAAPTSDNGLLIASFGVTMNQDNGENEDHPSSDFVQPDHPTLQGVEKFGSNGVSACTKGPGANAEVLVLFTTTVQANDSPDAGTKRSPTENDGALVVFEPGRGRGACLNDRDLFFNSSLEQNSHKTLGLNLVNWLAHKT